MATATHLDLLLKQVRACTLCSEQLPLGPRPVLQLHHDARILIAGQAPGLKVHQSGIPFDDASGDRLRYWMGVDRTQFYDPRKIAVLPMAFCYPGKGKSGDLPPPPLCAQTWRKQLLDHLPGIGLILVIGTYALKWHLPEFRGTLTSAVRGTAGPGHVLVLPHPSPRNNIWLKKNPWFDEQIIPDLRQRVDRLLS